MPGGYGKLVFGKDGPFSPYIDKTDTEMEKYEELCKLVETLKADLEKLYVKGNKSAGTRARALIQDIKRKGQEIRDEIQSQKAAIGKKRK